MLIDEKVDRNIKGKTINYSSDDYPDHNTKGAVADNFVGSSGKSSASASDNIDYADLFLDDVIDIDEYAQLLAHFDNVDIPPGVEAPMPPIPWLLDPLKSDIKSVSGSSSVDEKYQAAKSSASASHNVIDLDGPSSDASNLNDDYSGLYLEESIDIDPPKSNVEVFSGSSSILKTTQNDGVSQPLGLASSWKLPQASSSEKKQSYLQLQGSAPNLPVGVELSIFQKQTENNSPAKHVTETYETNRKFKDFKQFDTVEDHSDHHYTNKSSSTKQKNWAKRIQEEWKILEKDLPDTIFVRVYETRMDLLRAVIVGAEGTPYHDGLFYFDVSFPSDYPNVPPHVHYHSGGLRLNPNLYACGRVCLSLLNTWSGNSNEKWIPGVSTMLQVLVSVQGLILNMEPFFNEPGYESMKGSPSGETKSKKYNEDTFILSLRTMVYTMKTPPKYFEDFVVGHFRSRAQDILAACMAYMDGAQVGCLVKGLVQGVNTNKSFS